jgi:hypothetical protein
MKPLPLHQPPAPTHHSPHIPAGHFVVSPKALYSARRQVLPTVGPSVQRPLPQALPTYLVPTNLFPIDPTEGSPVPSEDH